LNITKNNYRVIVSGDIEIELHLFFHCSPRAAFCNNVREILDKCGLAGCFERLGHVDLMRLFIFGLPDASIPIQSLFLALLTTFWNPVMDSHYTRYDLL